MSHNRISAQRALPARRVTAVLGPTNTGKTHLAIERMLGHGSGMIGLPLRLLAREVYDRLCTRTAPENVALITGEEKIKPQNPRYYVCTVEAMPRDIEVELMAIDEIQLAADPERGHIFTDRLIHMRGTHETLLLGAETMKTVIEELVPNVNMVSRPRLSQLSYAGQKKISRLPRRTAIVAFSASDVYAIAELIRRQRGGAAVVMGALSPRTRNAQVELYQSGDVDFIIATDAIGMGLNLDVDHVAFAGARKFDGQRHRTLHPAELAQIAGRAGRHLNDGTFGVTANVEPFEQKLIDQLEEHQFPPLKTLQWRNNQLDFSSLEDLKDSLMAAPAQPYLARSRISDDILALETLARDMDVQVMARDEASLRRLWDVCQLPDYRNVSPQQHADIIAAIFKFIMSDKGVVPESWFEDQVAHADDTSGDIDTLANRIAHIRTWTAVSSRADWLGDPKSWQRRTHAIEDRLSDALHLKLTQRFVDRRTSVLMRRLRDREDLFAEIDKKGNIYVEKHFVGHLHGFCYSPDGSAEGREGKAVRNAAARILAGELAKKAGQLVAAKDGAFTLSRTGNILFEGEVIGRLERSDNILSPAPHLFSDEHLPAADRERIVKRLESWLASLIGEVLKPLVELQTASDITGLSRGIAFQLVENLGSLKRSTIAQDLRQLDQPARKQLRKYGVRFGAFNVFVPALLKPAAVELLLLLWALYDRSDNHIDPYDLPEPPRAGLTSDIADRKLPEQYYRTAGFQPCGPRVLRMDMLERLDQQIRPLIVWRAQKSTDPKPAGATGNGGFLVQADMLSILGCSWDEMKEILPALGFAVERRKVIVKKESEAARKTSQAALDALKDFVSLPAKKETKAPPEEEVFEEIWRPRRQQFARTGEHNRQNNRPAGQRNNARKGQHDARGPGRGKGRKPGNRPSNGAKSGAHPQRSRPKPRQADPDSPFAALGDLKKQLEQKKK